MGGMAVTAGLLTLISFALKGMGMLFRVYLSDRMGSTGLGLYQLIMSVYSIFATFATAGFTVAVSRLAAERLENRDKKGGAVQVLLASSALALAVGGTAAAVLYGGAELLAKSMVGDVSTAPALKVLALSMPFMALSACIKGYFTAVGQIYKPSVAAFFEQCAKIAITVYTFGVLNGNGTDLCVGVVIGLTAGECFSYAFLFIMYLFFSGKKDKRKGEESFIKTVGSVGAVTLPIAASAYVTNILHSVESVLIPSRFVLYGGNRDQALADFGTIRGMSIPLLFFPYSFLGALLSIQIPRVSRLNVGEDKAARNRLIKRIMELTAGFSFVCGGFFLLFSKQVSLAVYGNAQCAPSLQMLAWVTPFMYVETMSDGLLKAIGQQKRSLLFSVINSVFRIVAVLVFIPLSGAYGYLWLLIASNTLSFVLCFGRLKKVAGFSLGRGFVAPMLWGAFSLLVAYGVGQLQPFSHPMAQTVLLAAVTAGVYMAGQAKEWRQC